MIQNILNLAGYLLFELITLLIIANIIMSWVRPNPSNKIVQFIHGVTEPILSPLRRFTVFGALDFSAFAAILLLQFIIFPLYKFLVNLVF